MTIEPENLTPAPANVNSQAGRPWWVEELEAHWATGISHHDTRRAAKIALDQLGYSNRPDPSANAAVAYPYDMAAAASSFWRGVFGFAVI